MQPFLALALAWAALVAQPAPAPAAPTPPPPWRIGYVGPMSGANVEVGVQVQRGIQAYFDAVDASGGVFGRPLELLTRDDGYEPSRTAPAVRALIDDDHVLALLGNVGTPTAAVTVPIADEKHIPLIGALTGAGLLRKTPPDRWVINYRASYREEIAESVRGLVDELHIDPSEIGLFTQNDAYGDAGYDATIAELAAHGHPNTALVPQGRYARNTLDVEAALSRLIEPGVHVRAVIMIGTYAPCARFIELAHAYDFHPLFINVSFVGSESLAKALGGDTEGVVVTQVVPSPAGDSPAARAFQAAVPQAERSYLTFEGFIAAHALALALTRAGPEATPDGLVSALESRRAHRPRPRRDASPLAERPPTEPHRVADGDSRRRLRPHRLLARARAPDREAVMAHRSIERDLKLVATAGPLIIAALVGAIVHVAGALSESQADLADQVVPVQRSLGELVGAVSGVFLEQAALASTRMVDLTPASEHERREAALRKAGDELRALLVAPAIVEEPGYPTSAVSQLDQEISAFVANGRRLTDAVKACRSREAALAGQLVDVYARIGRLSDSAAALAGVLRLEYVAELRAVARELAAGHRDTERMRRVAMGTARAQSDVVNDIETAALRLGLLVGKAGHAQSLDALNALAANEFAQNVAQLRRALTAVEGRVVRSDLVGRVRELDALAYDLTRDVADPEHGNSVPHLRRAVLEARAEVLALQASASFTAGDLIAETAALRAFTDTLGRRAQMRAADAIAQSRLVTVLVIVGSLAFAIVVALRIRASVRALRDQNLRLSRLSSDLAGANSTLEARVSERTASLTAANADLAREMEARTRVELELRQAQKLEAVGRLAAGVAHEINTPVQFVGDSASFARDAFDDILAVLKVYRAVLDDAAHGKLSSGEAAARAHDAEEDKDIDYLEARVPEALDRVKDGVARVATIVRAMKEFSHPDRADMAEADLNQAIRSTLVVATNEYKYVADLATDLGELPPVPCRVGELNQVVLNLIVNAAHAIEDRIEGSDERGLITVRSRRDGEWARIEVSDTGGGIPEAIRERVFDPFFTTKEVGRGTGQGLAIARAVVVEKHGGTLAFETEAGVGTTFVIRLPLTERPRPRTATGIADRPRAFPTSASRLLRPELPAPGAARPT
ncbi:MAG: ABC transporter substrate-binding protein [Myxococcota bacterium]